MRILLSFNLLELHYADRYAIQTFCGDMSVVRLTIFILIINMICLLKFVIYSISNIEVTLFFII